MTYPRGEVNDLSWGRRSMTYPRGKMSTYPLTRPPPPLTRPPSPWPDHLPPGQDHLLPGQDHIPLWPCDLSHDAFGVSSLPLPTWTDRYLWKHNLRSLHYAGGKYQKNCKIFQDDINLVVLLPLKSKFAKLIFVQASYIWGYLSGWTSLKVTPSYTLFKWHISYWLWDAPWACYRC